MAEQRIAVVGAGLCGTLLAIRLAQRGKKVDLFEKRPDLRTEQMAAGRSINLALSDRGIRALRRVDIAEEVMAEVIPMKGRMLHFRDGSTSMSPYSGRSTDYINSVSRSGLNAKLLDKAEEYPGITIYFEAECLACTPEKAHLCFRLSNGSTLDRNYESIFGADGAGSAVRQAFLERSNSLRFNYQQFFLTHGYKELEFPATPQGDFAVEPNALHIWPRNDFMMIALPNLDKSFTVTLFQRFKGSDGFDQLTEPRTIRTFFETHFSDALSFMPNLLSDFEQNPASSLGTIKCNPWHIEGNVLLIGDAAHAIVPFYGQGMNCAFEDVVVLDEIIEEHGFDWQNVFAAYTRRRKKDTDAIADLALDNFIEMQDKVSDPAFLEKRKLETALERSYPDYYSKYSLVTFREDLPYHRAMEQGRFQDEYLLEVVRSNNNEPLDPAEVYKSLMKTIREKFGDQHPN